MSTKQELIQRALTTSNFASQIHQDLSDLITMITPQDVQMFRRLLTNRATAITHEWSETTLTGTFTTAAYADGSAPAEHTNTHTVRNNKVMSLGRVAKASNLLNATNTVGKNAGMDAFATEMEEKLVDLLRAIEYYIFNGDKTNTSPQEMDGLLTLSTGFNQVENAGSAAVLVEAKLNEAIKACYDSGGSPDLIVANPGVCYRIANFTADKIRWMGNGSGAGGVDKGSLQYLSPLGNMLDVVPVRTDFMATGSVLVLDSSKIKLSWLSQGIETMDLALDGDVVSKKLIKCYLSLECRAQLHHTLLTNVLNAIA